MGTSDKIALAALIVSAVFSGIALLQTRGARASAAKAETRAQKAEARADEAVAIAERQASAVEALSEQVALSGPQAIEWQFERIGDSYFALRNRGTQTQHDVTADLVGRSVHGQADKPTAETLEKNGAFEMFIPQPPPAIRVTCRSEPEGRLVEIPRR